MKHKSLLAAMFALGMLTSCDDMLESGTKPDGSNPYVTINSPTNHHSFTRANGVALNLTVVDKDEVKELSIKIRDTNGEPPIINFTKKFTKTVAVLDTVVAANQILPGSYNLFITAKDGRTNVEEKIITFVVKE